jgi:hypothetical protein
MNRPVWPDADYGYHLNDANLALGHLVADVAAAESTWTPTHHQARHACAKHACRGTVARCVRSPTNVMVRDGHRDR